jgi:hypothetical protein
MIPYNSNTRVKEIFFKLGCIANEHKSPTIAPTWLTSEQGTTILLVCYKNTPPIGGEKYS